VFGATIVKSNLARQDANVALAWRRAPLRRDDQYRLRPSEKGSEAGREAGTCDSTECWFIAFAACVRRLPFAVS